VIGVESLDDPRLDDYRLIGAPTEIQRRGLFVIEGRRILRRVVDRPRYRLHSVLVTQTALEALAGVRSILPSRVPIYVVSQSVMNHVVGFDIHRGCLALAERPPIESLQTVDLTTARRLIVLEGVNNPDNVGGIFRSGAAFGVDLVVLGPNCGDPLYRKAIRTSMGASLQVAFVAAGAWPAALGDLRAAGLRALALTPATDALPLEDFDRALPQVALVVGSEGDGLSAGALSAADARVRIPMTGPVESLNVTVAASIALHYFR
jgi:tRNA G18 (ribose-2'-O)-methylase SpoU